MSGPDVLEFSGPSSTFLWSDVPPRNLATLVASTTDGTATRGTLTIPRGIFTKLEENAAAGVTGSAGLPLTTYGVDGTGPPNATPAEYVISEEGVAIPSDWPPPLELPDLGNVQNLPDTVGTLIVPGRIRPGWVLPMFLLQIGEGTEAIQIAVQASSASMPSPDRMWVFDQAGHKLMEGRPDPLTHSIHLNLLTADLTSHGRRPRALFLQFLLPSNWVPTSAEDAGSIPAVGTSGQDTSPMAFVLSVSRQAVSFAPPGPPSAGTPAGPQRQQPLPESSRVGSLDPGPSTSASTVFPVPSQATAPAPLVGVTVTVGIATGPLPARSSAPLGGILNGGDDPAPVVPRSETVAAVDLALMDPPQDEPSAEFAAEALSTIEPPGGAVAALRGPGGFPLLGSSLFAEGRFVRPGLADRLPAISFTRPAPPTSSTGLPGPSAPVPEDATSPARRPGRTARRLSALTGVSLALAFVSGAVLPDFTDPTRRRGPTVRSRIRDLLARGRVV